MSDPVYLFVYGTLRASAEHPMGDLLRANAELVGSGTIQARLYIIDDPDMPGENSYPGALPSANPGDRVHGELYLLRNPDTVLPSFDDFEACSARWPEPHEFLRRRVSVSCADGSQVQAVCYLYTWDVTSAQPVATGRFTDIANTVQ